MSSSDFELVTLPRICAAHGLPLDAARERVRRDPALRGLGRQFGAARVFTPAEAERIAQAVREYRSRRAKVATAK